MSYTIEQIKELLNKITPWFETNLTLFKSYIESNTKLSKIFNEDLKLSKEWNIWYINSFDSEWTKKQILNEDKNKWQPEEIVRQLYLIKLVEEYWYSKELIKCEVSVSFWREKKRADIVIYQNTDLATPWIIVEAKEPKQRNNIQQLKSYLNADWVPIGVWINGNDISIFLRPYPKDFEIMPDIPKFNEFEQVKYLDQPTKWIRDIILSRKWKYDDLVEYNKTQNFNLKTIIQDLEELVLANSWVDSFNEIFKLIYAKLYDEFEAENTWNWELKFKSYVSAKVTYKEINNLFLWAKNEWKDIFDIQEEIKLKPEHLDICIPKLEKIKLYWNNLRIIDEAFEYLVPEASKSKKWQYFTPRIIIDTCIKILNPTNEEYVLDPSCWSAGFLVHNMQYVWWKYNLKTYRQKSHYAWKYLYWIDFDEKSAKISKAIMLIAWDGKTHIFNENTLDYKKWSDKAIVWLKDEELIKWRENRDLNFDIILSNPPFAWDIWEKELITQYRDLLWDKADKKSVDRHILFIQRILDMLKPGWRTAIILPQWVFNNTNDKYIREYILDKARILWVVWLHWNSFKPHTWTKTSIFFLKKWDSEEQRQQYQNDDYEIFMWVNKVSAKDNSWNYIFLKDDNWWDKLTEKDNFPYKKWDLVYKTDLLDIADAFINFWKDKLSNWDEMFNFLNK
jgi:type I restriction enzyme M protein